MEPTNTHTHDLAYAADLTKCSQITNDYQQMARELAGPLEAIVAKVFPGHLLMVYLLTDIRRRQVWNAYLSSHRVAPHHDGLTEDQAAELRVKLLICRSYDLIVDGYGSSERGLIGLYGKLGPTALSAQFYLLFHKTLTANEGLRRSLCHAPSIYPKALSLVFILPPELQSYPFARELLDCGASTQFLELYPHIQNQSFPNKLELMERLHRLIRIGRGFRAALKDIQRALAFPPQAIPDEGPLRFISNGQELCKIADRYFNCLRGEVSSALSDECQYYEWHSEPPAIICLKRHRERTWYITEIHLRDNASPSEALDIEIRAHFARYGIGERRCVADLFDRLLGHTVNVDEELEEFAAMQGR